MDGTVKWASVRAFPKGTTSSEGNVLAYVLYKDQGDESNNRNEVLRIFRKSPALPASNCPLQIRLGDKPNCMGRLELTEAGKLHLQEMQTCQCT